MKQMIVPPSSVVSKSRQAHWRCHFWGSVVRGAGALLDSRIKCRDFVDAMILLRVLGDVALEPGRSLVISSQTGSIAIVGLHP